ncbi:MFS transporter [Microlunatus ginsengisoli]|uniref:MFS transporter n=2 Tax=Microlunatus ginsengisoli TaxID=363863 RepID=A0ABP7AK09_9ACTN
MIALGVVSMLTDVSSESVSAILPLYITAVLGMSPLAYGFIDGIYQGVSALVRMLGGWWADSSRRPKWVAFTGYAGSALSRIAMLFTTSFAGITGAVTVDRLGKGLRTGPRDALIATAAPPDQLGRNFGVHRALDTAGALAGPLLAFAVIALIPVGLGGYRSVFVMSAAFAVVGVVVLAVLVPNLRTAAEPSTRAEARTASRGAWRDLARPELRRLVLAAGVLGLLTVGDGFLYLALAQTGNLGAQYFPLLFVGTNAAYLALAVPFGRLADRVGRGRVFVGGYVVLLLAYLVALSALPDLARTIGTLLLLGAFYACTDGVLAALAARAVPEVSRSRGISAAQTAVALSRFAASVGFGVLWQFTGVSTALVVMAIGLAVAIPIAAWLLRVRRPDGSSLVGGAA